MPSNSGDRLITTGVIGDIFAVICCVTPVPIVLFGALGLAGATGYLDYALLAAMVIFLGLIVYGCWSKRSCTVEKQNRPAMTSHTLATTANVAPEASAWVARIYCSPLDLRAHGSEVLALVHLCTRN